MINLYEKYLVIIINMENQRKEIIKKAKLELKRKIKLLEHRNKQLKKKSQLILEEIKTLTNNVSLIDKNCFNLKLEGYSLKLGINPRKKIVYIPNDNETHANVYMFQKENIHSTFLSALLELTDGKIVTGSEDGKIAVLVIDYVSDNIKILTTVKAHEGLVKSLCEINNKDFKITLASCSYDEIIKIWSCTGKQLELIQKISGHESNIKQLIRLSNQEFASCSSDCTIKIWSNSHPYKEIKTLRHDDWVYTMIKLRERKLILSSCGDKTINFWNLNTFKKEAIIKECLAFFPSEMIEISNGNVAVSSKTNEYPILILDTRNYIIIKKIIFPEFTSSNSTLLFYDDHSFLYVFNGKIIQIAYNDYEIIYHTQKNKILYKCKELICVQGGKYFVMCNDYIKGVSVIRVDYFIEKECELKK